MPKIDRIPFLEALSEPLLFADHAKGLSLPQRSLLFQTYGVELNAKKTDDRGFSELDYWGIFQGFCEQDELGFPKKLQPGIPDYIPKEYQEAWLIVGRRGGKTDRFAATIVAYEALCGGHEAFLRKGQRGICFQIAQDLRMARYSLHFIRATLESSPIGKKAITQITADRIDLSNGITIFCVPPTTKSVRGYANPVSVFDEVGMWYQESDSANPDYEIFRAVTPGQIQFPFRKIVGISSPWNKAGLLFRNYEAGTEGRKLPLTLLRDEFKGVFVGHGTTAAMGNPLVTREYLVKERMRDPKSFERECLAVFQDSISGFIAAALVERAIIGGVQERAPEPHANYVAAIDPAFRRDAFAVAIGHRDKEGVVWIDAVRRFVGRHDQPLNPAAVLSIIAPLIRSYGVSFVYSDQHHIESLGQLARSWNIEIVEVPFTQKAKAQAYGNLQQLFHQGKIRLVDDYELKKEIKMLEKSLSEAGSIMISAPPGFHDDMATVACIVAQQSMLLYPDAAPEAPRDPTYQERIQAQIEARGKIQVGPWD